MDDPQQVYPRQINDDPLGAFCRDSDAFLPGAADGPLAGLTFAAKDLFDVAGHVTGGGNPDWKASHTPAAANAWAVDALVRAGATMVGKTITDELSRGIFGENRHYGTPLNPRAPGRVPGGSSSGSAAAVAGGLVDFALGSDTGGSVRIPASFCGLYGIRPTHGRIPVTGMLQQAPSYDTVGWFARDADLFARVGAVLLQASVPDDGWFQRLVVAEDAFELADNEVQQALRPAVGRIAALVGETATERLSPTSLDDWHRQHVILQGQESWETFRDWLDQTNPRLGYEAASKLQAGSVADDDAVALAREAKSAIVRRLGAVIAGDAVICLPTAPCVSPLAGQRQSLMRELRQRIIALTCIAGALGAPQISLPLGVVRTVAKDDPADGLPVGLSLIGAPGTDERLLAFARRIIDAGK